MFRTRVPRRTPPRSANRAIRLGSWSAHRPEHTAAIDGSASPRNPSVARCSRSSRSTILLVAWEVNARARSSGAMPSPSSVTRIIFKPASRTSTEICEAPASIALSSSSFTADAGRSTTSPAAILSARSGDMIRMGRRSFIPEPRRRRGASTASVITATRFEARTSCTRSNFTP